MKNNKNRQPVQGNLTDKKGKQNEGTEANPKREGNTPEKITPVENKKNEQTGDLKNQTVNERPDKRKTPVANETNNNENGQTGLNTPKGDLNEGKNGTPDSRKEDKRSEKNKTTVLDREDDDMGEDIDEDMEEEMEEEVEDNDHDYEKEEVPSYNKK